MMLAPIGRRDQKSALPSPARCGSRTHTLPTAPVARLLAALLALVVLSLSSATALAQRTHVVRPGQSLARIAQRYDVRVADLAAANGLGRDAQVRPGMELRVPEAGVTYVRPGQTLSEIARDAHCSVAELVRLNRLRDGQGLRVGQRIVLPGFEAHEEAEQAASRWGRPRAPGVVTFYRTATKVRSRFRLVDERGRASRTGTRRIAEVMRPRDARRAERFPNPPARLIELVARISDHFGGRVVHVISGYRHAGGYTRDTSQHIAGHAIDIRIAGVPNTTLRDYLRTLDHVGVGYYPRSSFVHLDVRERSAYWVDWSRPGEAPRYQRRGEAPPDDATGEERRRVGEGGDDVGEEGGETAVESEDADDGSEAGGDE